VNNASIGAFAILEVQRKIVVVRHANGERKLSLPGGGLEAGETPTRAIVREVWEETGLSDVAFRHIGTFFLRKSAGVVFLFHSREFCYEGEVADYQEIADVVLIDPDNLPTDLYPAQRKLIERWRNDNLGNRGYSPFDLL